MVLRGETEKNMFLILNNFNVNKKCATKFQQIRKQVPLIVNYTNSLAWIPAVVSGCGGLLPHRMFHASRTLRILRGIVRVRGGIQTDASKKSSSMESSGPWSKQRIQSPDKFTLFENCCWCLRRLFVFFVIVRLCGLCV